MKNIRILYIDNHQDHRIALARGLRSLNYHITSAATAESGLRLFARRTFDIVLCEWDLPGKTGLQILEIIREKEPEVPFILLSASGTASRGVKAVKKGASCFVLKPKGGKEISILIGQTMEKSNLEKKKRESLASIQTVSENVPDIIYSLNPRGEFISLSRSVKSIMGYHPSELIGTSVFLVIHPEDRERVRKSFLSSMEAKERGFKSIQFRMITKKGKVRYFEIHRKIVFEHGRVIRNDGIARDVSNRVLLEKKLKKYHEEVAEANLNLLAVQEQLKEKNTEMERLLEKLSSNRQDLQTILDASPDVIFLVDQNGKIKASNKKVADYFGFPLEKVVNSSYDEFVKRIKNDFEDPARFDKQIMHLNKNPDRTSRIELPQLLSRGVPINKHKPGVLAPIGTKIKTSRQKERSLLWIYTDIAFLKNAEEQVHAIVDSSPIPTLISRLKDGHILWANKELADLAGMTVQELIGQKTPDFYYAPEDRKTVLESLKRDGFLRNFETRIIKADRSVIWMIFSLVVTHMRGEDVAIGWLYEISERKRVEEALTKERNFVSAVLKTESALVVVLDSEGRIVRFNHACEQISGYSLDEVKMKHVWDIFLIPEEIDRVKAVFEELRSYKIPNKTENYWVTESGECRLISWSNSVLLDDEGSVEYIIGTGIDITEHRLAEQAILTRLKYEQGLAACSQALMKESESKDSLVEALSHLNEASNTSSVYILENFEDPQLGLCARLTHQVCPECITGKSESLGQKHFVYSRGFDRWRKNLSKGKPVRGTVKTLPKKEVAILELLGTRSILALPLWVEGKWYGMIGFEDNKELREWSEDDIRMLQTAADIIDDYIERKRIAEDLRVSEERFRGLVENANDLIFSLSSEGHFTYLSPKLTDLLGYDTSDFLGKYFTELMHPDDVKKSVDLFRQRLKNGRKETGFEFRMKHKDGSIRWFISNSSVILDERGMVIEVVGVAHDITEMKKVLIDLEHANATLKKAQSQLVQSEKMAALGNLVAGIAHEINTPIGAVNSMYDTVFRSFNRLKSAIETKIEKDDELIPRLEATFKILDDSSEVIRLGTERVTNLVQRLKSFARLDEAELKTVDIHDGLEETLTLIHHELKQYITVKRKYGNIPPVSCFPSMLNQVFLNLLINSRQAIKEKGTIEISTFVKDTKVHIVIKDNGRGISNESLQKIFDPGFTTKGRGVGTGLGLSISYQIIQQHRGEIKVESVLGKGSTFTVILPMDLEKLLENDNVQT